MSAGGLPVLAAPAAWEGPVFVEISAGPVRPGQQASKYPPAKPPPRLALPDLQDDATFTLGSWRSFTIMILSNIKDVMLRLVVMA